MKRSTLRLLALALLIPLSGWALAWLADAQGVVAKTPLKEPDAVLKGLEKVISTSDGKASLFTLYVHKKEARVIAELPKDFEKKKYFVALTVASGETLAGLQEGDLYVTWRRYGDRWAVIEPDLANRS